MLAAEFLDAGIHAEEVEVADNKVDAVNVREYKNQNDRRVRKLMEEGRKPVGYDWLYCDQIKNVSREKTGHPCQMPLSVMLYVVSSLPKDAVIVEPFAGSGTTCLAAKRTGRHYVGFEISGNYCEAANRRLRDDSPLLDGAVLTE